MQIGSSKSCCFEIKKMKYGLRCLFPSKAWCFSFKRFVEKKGLLLRGLRDQNGAWGARWGSGSKTVRLGEQIGEQGRDDRAQEVGWGMAGRWPGTGPHR